MPAITNKQQLLAQVLTALKKKYPLPVADEAVEARPLLEEIIYAICREASVPAETDAGYARLRAAFVDWNEVRVARPQVLVAVLGRTPRAQQRITTLHRFLESYFLRQRCMNPDHLFTLKAVDSRRFVADLEVFDREELSAVLLTGFGQPFFPPCDQLLETAEGAGLVKPKTTALQMAKKFETAVDEKMMNSLYSHLYALYHDPERDTILKRKKK